MTVKELMEILSGMPEDYTVIISQPYTDDNGELIGFVYANADKVYNFDDGYVHLEGKPVEEEED